MKTILDIVITEVPGDVTDINAGWFMNIGKYNSEDDIRITKHLAQEILAEQASRRRLLANEDSKEQPNGN